MPDYFLPKFARSTSLAIPVARLIPAEVSKGALTSFMTATAWFADARAAIAYVDPDDVRAVFKDVIGLKIIHLPGKISKSCCALRQRNVSAGRGYIV